MLKSTHRPLPKSAAESQPLPAGWTQHAAPTGHAYYYNAETGKSTYTRPGVEQPHAVVAPPEHFLPNQNLYLHASNPTYNESTSHHHHGRPGQPGANRPGFYDARNAQQQDRRHRYDRPKSAHPVPGCAPWLLVKTRFGRRFVHNPHTNESFWKFPKDVIGGVVEFDIQERKKRERLYQGDGADDENVTDGVAVETTEESRPLVVPAVHDARAEEGEGNKEDQEEEEEEEYEEVELTDEDSDDHNPSKRRKKDADNDDDDDDTAATGEPPPLEFGEEDMAYQLAAMGEKYELQPGEYGDEDAYDEDGDWDDGATGLELTAAERTASFEELLDDHAINPFTTWDSIIAGGRLVDDDRYTLLPNMRARKAAFADWSAGRIRAQQRAKAAAPPPRDPRIAYLALLQQHARPTLFWPEFRRKFKRESAMRDTALDDRAREKLYREHIARMTKTAPESLKADLAALLTSLPPSAAAWSRDVVLADALAAGSLPPQLLADLRFISLKPAVRDPLIVAHIATLPPASAIEPADAGAGLAGAERQAAEQELAKRETALREREAQVDAAKRRQQRELAAGRQRLRGEEEELRRAMQVGREGLQAQLME